MLEAVKKEENLIASLPEIPPAAHENPVDPDMMLRERLLRLKM